MNITFNNCIFLLRRITILPLVLFFSIFTIVSCDDEIEVSEEDVLEDEDTEEVENILSEGFVINVETPNGDHIVKYFDEIPSGTADLSDGQTFQNFLPRDIYSSAIFLAKPDGTNFFSKIIVDATGTIVESATISVTGDTPVTIKVINDSTGILHDRNSSTTLNVFNPSTMEIEGAIDMSAGGYSDQRFQTIYVEGDLIFSPLRPDIGGVYDKLVVQSANFITGQYENTTEYAAGNTFPQDEFGQNNVDEEGNVYVQALGDPAGGQPIASIHKIPAGSTEFDESYYFVPGAVANPANTLLPAYTGFNYYQNDIGFAVVAVSVPQELIDLVISVGGANNLSATQIQEALAILFAAENARWAKLNLVDQTVEIIEDIPAQSPFAQTSYLEKDGEIYFSVTTTETNAFYKYDPDTGAAVKAFDVTGGSIIGIYDISQNH